VPLILLGLSVALPEFLAAIVLLGLARTATSQHGSASSGSFLDFITGRTYLHAVSGWSAQFARWVVSHFAAGQLVMLARYFNSMATLTVHFARSLTAFAGTLTTTLERMEHVGDRRARAKAATANAHAIHAGRAAARANTHAGHVQHDLTSFKARTEPRLNHLTHATTVVLPRDIGRVRTREGELSRDLGKLRDRTKSLEDGAVETWDWIRSHPLSGVTAVFTGAVAIALARLGFGFLRCRNWQQLGKRMTCGMGATLLHLLEAVAAFTLGGLAILKPEVLAEETVAAVDGIEFILTQILDN
jgi:hypothetical protein